jgi:hypothetical protein
MARILHVAPIEDQRWVVTLDDDAEPAISEHTSRAEAETAARAYAESFGYPEIDVHGVDGAVDVQLLFDEVPLERPPYPGGATGESAA